MARINLSNSSLGISSRESAYSSSQLQMDSLWQGFSSQAADLHVLGAMSAGSLAFSLIRQTSLSLFPIFFQKSFLFQSVCSGLALLGEVSVFRAVNDFSSWRDPSAFLGTLTDFICLKGVGHFLRGQNPLLRHFSQASGMVLGELSTEALHFRESHSQSFAERFVHASVSSLALEAGGQSICLLTGGRGRMIERNRVEPDRLSHQGDVFSERLAEMRSGVRKFWEIPTNPEYQIAVGDWFLGCRSAFFQSRQFKKADGLFETDLFEICSGGFTLGDRKTVIQRYASGSNRWENLSSLMIDSNFRYTALPGDYRFFKEGRCLYVTLVGIKPGRFEFAQASFDNPYPDASEETPVVPRPVPREAPRTENSGPQSAHSGQNRQAPPRGETRASPRINIPRDEALAFGDWFCRSELIYYAGAPAFRISGGHLKTENDFTFERVFGLSSFDATGLYRVSRRIDGVTDTISIDVEVVLEAGRLLFDTIRTIRTSPPAEPSRPIVSPVAVVKVIKDRVFNAQSLPNRPHFRVFDLLEPRTLFETWSRSEQNLWDGLSFAKRGLIFISEDASTLQGSRLTPGERNKMSAEERVRVGEISERVELWASLSSAQRAFILTLRQRWSSLPHNHQVWRGFSGAQVIRYRNITRGRDREVTGQETGYNIVAHVPGLSISKRGDQKPTPLQVGAGHMQNLGPVGSEVYVYYQEGEEPLRVAIRL